jgi:putative protease
MFMLAKKACPEIPLHISTQANNTNYETFNFWFNLGAERVVCARELSLVEIAQIRQHIPEDREIEAFVHGAMCMAWSGRCMISAYLTGRSANRGACTQSCRWRYHLVEEKRPGEFFPVEEDERGTTILSSHDLNCLDFLDQIAAAGVTSFKIEGRMKSPYYVATVTNAYRQRMDGLARGPADPAELALLQRELNAVSHRAYASGFYFGEMRRHAPDDGVYRQDCVFVGMVTARLDDGRVRVQLRNRIRRGDLLEVLRPGSHGEPLRVENLTAPDGTPLEQVTEPMTLFDMDAPVCLEAGDMLRMRS